MYSYNVVELYLLIHSFSEREVFYVAFLETMPVAKFKYLCSKFVEQEWKKGELYM